MTSWRRTYKDRIRRERKFVAGEVRNLRARQFANHAVIAYSTRKGTIYWGRRRYDTHIIRVFFDDDPNVDRDRSEWKEYLDWESGFSMDFLRWFHTSLKVRVSILPMKEFNRRKTTDDRLLVMIDHGDVMTTKLYEKLGKGNRQGR